MSLHSLPARGPRAAVRIVMVALVVTGGILMSTLARVGPEVALRLPPDRIYDEQGSPAAVVFSHERHAAYSDNRCLTCHPQPFSILGRHQPVGHEEMDVGGSCGICHNGRDATGVQDADSCATCHTGPAAAQTVTPAPLLTPTATQAPPPSATVGAPAPSTPTAASAPDAAPTPAEAAAATAPPAPKKPPPVRLARRADSPGQVVFRHTTHEQQCKTCHREPFAMKAGTTPADGFAKEAMLGGATCGKCHDGQSSFAVDDDDHCETCHQSEEEAP